jgi:predicted DNA-binding protein
MIDITGDIYMKRGGYALDLKKQIKVRIDNITFERLTQLSEENEKTISSLLRDIIIDRLEQEG